MKYKNITLCILLIWFVASPAFTPSAGAAGEKKVAVTILSCSAMSAAPEIREILGGIDGVLKHRIDSQMSEVTVTFDPGKTSAHDIVEALENEGFDIHGSPTVSD